MHIVDSCGWIEYFTDDVNRAFFEPVLLNERELLVSDLSIFEVSRRLKALYGTDAAQKAYRVMSNQIVVGLDAAGMHAAAQAGVKHKLHLADAIIWQTCQRHNATLHTQDSALAHLPGVRFRPKPALTSVTSV